MVFEYGKWDFVLEPGREQIHQWREKRLKRMSARKSHVLYYLKIFNMDILQSFAQNMNFMVWLSFCPSLFLPSVSSPSTELSNSLTFLLLQKLFQKFCL